MISMTLYLLAGILMVNAIIGLAFVHPTLSHSVRRTSLTAAVLSFAVMTYAFLMRPVELQVVEKPVVVTRERIVPGPVQIVKVEKIVPGPAVEPTPEYGAKVYEAVQSRYVKRYRESVNGSLSAANPSVE